MIRGSPVPQLFVPRKNLAQQFSCDQKTTAIPNFQQPRRGPHAIGKMVTLTRMAVSSLFLNDPQQLQDGGIEIVNMRGIFDDVLRAPRVTPAPAIHMEKQRE